MKPNIKLIIKNTQSMKRIALFLIIAAVAISSAEAQKVKRTKQKESDGFKWTLIEQDGYKGAEIKKGVKFIPVENHCENVCYIGDGFFSSFKAGEGNCVMNKNGKQIINGGEDEIYFRCQDGFVFFTYQYSESVYDTNGRLIIPIERKYKYVVLNGAKTIFNVYSKFDHHNESNRIAGVCDLMGNEIIPPSRGYNSVHQISIEMKYYDRTREWIYYSVVKDGREGACDIDGKEIVAPENNKDRNELYCDRTYHYFYYLDKHKIKHYLGVKLNSNSRGILDPDHPLGTTDKPVPEEQPQEETVYNTTTTNFSNSYSNSYNNTYNNSYTPPAQHKQQSTGNKSNSTTQPKSTPKSSTGTSSSSKPSTTRTPKERTHPFENYNTPVKCGQCSGTGMMRCFSCSGKGTIRKSGIDKNGKQVFRNERCTGCGGSGKRKCTVCNGKGTR